MEIRGREENEKRDGGKIKRKIDRQVDLEVRGRRRERKEKGEKKNRYSYVDGKQ